MNGSLPKLARNTRRLSFAERMERFSHLQQRAFALLRASPEGWRRYWERNLKKRRLHWSP
ncbi:MAG TPA: hypothetical protein PLU30_24405 [Verrucomicrobiae bacterium]|nr:hypothetical protein [Verrucomicrobiae bacterium]